ncbi:MAG: universal stress protein [Pseudomonadota bacterium]
MSEGRQRRRKLLVVVDDTPECERAIVYAAHRAKALSASVLALCVAQESEFQHWLGVEKLMREEAEEEAAALMERVLGKVRDVLPGGVERLVVVGERASAIRQLIENDPDIAILMLAAAPGSDGPGPLVNAIVNGLAGSFPVPITIVPGGLSDAEIIAINQGER